MEESKKFLWWRNDNNFKRCGEKGFVKYFGYLSFVSCIYKELEENEIYIKILRRLLYCLRVLDWCKMEIFI